MKKTIFKAAQARRLANNVRNGKVKPAEPRMEFDRILAEIGYAASIGEYSVLIDRNHEHTQLLRLSFESLGYEVTPINTSKPYLKISWLRKED